MEEIIKKIENKYPELSGRKVIWIENLDMHNWDKDVLVVGTFSLFDPTHPMYKFQKAYAEDLTHCGYPKITRATNFNGTVDRLDFPVPEGSVLEEREWEENRPNALCNVTIRRKVWVNYNLPLFVAVRGGWGEPPKLLPL
jgi:hypothetical protein